MLGRFFHHSRARCRQIGARQFGQAGQFIAARVARIGVREKGYVPVFQALRGEVGYAWL